MRILLDECVSGRLCRALTDHHWDTAVRAGFRGLKNGALLDAAERTGFDALITVDNSLPYQNRIAHRRIAVVILRAPTNQLEDLLPLCPACLKALAQIRSGKVVRIERPQG